MLTNASGMRSTHVVAVGHRLKDGVLELAPLVAGDLGVKQVLPLQGEGHATVAEEGVVDPLHGSALRRGEHEQAALGRKGGRESVEPLDARGELFVPRPCGQTAAGVRPSKLTFAFRKVGLLRIREESEAPRDSAARACKSLNRTPSSWTRYKKIRLRAK